MEEVNNIKTILCPVVKRQISGMDCFDAALVYEEMSPLSEFPCGFEFTESNKSICLKCEYHPT